MRKRGHEAYSCDVLPNGGGHLEWHINQDVLPLLNGNCSFNTEDGIEHYINRWDMIIAFPPCTHLAVSGARVFEKKRENGLQRQGVEFFCQFLNVNCDKVVIENPINIISGKYIQKYFPDLCEKYGLPIKPTQIIQPWMFGDNAQKQTCLWIKGLQPLVPEITEQPPMEYFEWVDKKTGVKKRSSMWHYETAFYSKKERGKMRSKTFKGIARAMAEQWTDLESCKDI